MSSAFLSWSALNEPFARPAAPVAPAAPLLDELPPDPVHPARPIRATATATANGTRMLAGTRPVHRSGIVTLRVQATSEAILADCRLLSMTFGNIRLTLSDVIPA